MLSFRKLTALKTAAVRVVTATTHSRSSHSATTIAAVRAFSTSNVNPLNNDSSNNINNNHDDKSKRDMTTMTTITASTTSVVEPLTNTTTTTEAAEQTVIKRTPKQQSWLSAQWKLYSELSKFRLISLVVVTSGAGYICAGSPMDFSTMAACCIGTGLCAGAAGTFNQVMEKEADSLMKRTQTRPLPSGKISRTGATIFGTVAGVSGVSMLLATTNPVTAALGAANILLYAPIYTYSKRFTELNTWIGSVVGAIPPLMGWAAATGGSLASPDPWALATLLFLWQFPHFFALSWLHREDYARGNFAMVPVNDITGRRTADFIQEYSYYLTAFPIITAAMGWTSYMFAVEGTMANLYLLNLTRKFSQDRTNANARRIFLTSLWYLPLLLAGFVFHNRVWQEKKLEEGEEVDQFAEALLETREKLKGMCMHEMIVGSETKSAPQLCIKVNADNVSE